jgi:predicted nuclease of predicted toxin-antitoxin system
MKLLFDQNLSPSLIKLLADVFPDSNHVFPLGLGESEDTKIWEYAQTNGFTLVTKDADFGDLSILRGCPPKTIWIKRGNCKTSDIEKILRNNLNAIQKLEEDDEIGLLTLF